MTVSTRHELVETQEGEAKTEKGVQSRRRATTANTTPTTTAREESHDRNGRASGPICIRLGGNGAAGSTRKLIYDPCLLS